MGENLHGNLFKSAGSAPLQMEGQIVFTSLDRRDGGERGRQDGEQGSRGDIN